jgi:hypothetical protein
MQFFFTEEDESASVRGADIREALAKARHRVIHGQLGQTPPEGTDVWMHGLGKYSVPPPPPLEPSFAKRLLSSNAQLVLFQLCDAASMSFYRIPDELARSTRLFLRNHWPKDELLIPEQFRGRIGFLPPMLKPMKPKAGKPLQARSQGSFFVGTRTGLSNLPDGRNARVETVRIMRSSGLPFIGGLLSHPEYESIPPELLMPKVSERKHARLLEESKFCLAPWGNHPITYRFFEGLAHRCLVVAQSLGNTRFLDGGLEPGKHYVEVRSDLSDLAEVVRYYSDHLDEAQRIADAGYAHYVRYFATSGGRISQWLFDASVASWGNLYQPSRNSGLVAATRAYVLRRS